MIDKWSVTVNADVTVKVLEIIRRPWGTSVKLDVGGQVFVLTKDDRCTATITLNANHNR